MHNETLMTIDDESLEAVSGAGIGATIGGALDNALSFLTGILGSGLSALGGLISGLGKIVGGLNS
jgi:hypothetical protein